MGFYSEQDIELRYGDSPFEEGGSPPDNTRMQSTPAFTERSEERRVGKEC